MGTNLPPILSICWQFHKTCWQVKIGAKPGEVWTCHQIAIWHSTSSSDSADAMCGADFRKIILACLLHKKWLQKTCNLVHKHDFYIISFFFLIPPVYCMLLLYENGRNEWTIPLTQSLCICVCVKESSNNFIIHRLRGITAGLCHLTKVNKCWKKNSQRMETKDIPLALSCEQLSVHRICNL